LDRFHHGPVTLVTLFTLVTLVALVALVTLVTPACGSSVVSATTRDETSSESRRGSLRWWRLASTRPPAIERTDVDVRIGVTQAPREINLELPDDLDRADLKARIEAALSGAVDVLWFTDKRSRDIGIAAAKIAYVEVGTPEGDRRIGFGS
jgi:hypothetical protein